MTSSLLERPRFSQSLRELFDGASRDWFIGVDRMIDEMSRKWDEAMASFNHFPASHVERIDDNHFRIRVHVPGYEKADLEVKIVDEDELVITGRKESSSGEREEHSSFEQRFLLADTAKVDSAKVLDNDLVIEVSFQVLPKAPETRIPIE